MAQKKRVIIHSSEPCQGHEIIFAQHYTMIFSAQSLDGVFLIEIEKLVDRKDLGNHERLVATLEKRLLQDKLKEQQRGSLTEFLKGKKELDRDDVLQLVRLIMSTPQYQLT